MPASSSNWVAIAASCFAIGLAGTWLARRYALRRQLVDQPGDRRSHQVPTPRGGGIAIVAALLVAVVLLIFREPGHGRFLVAFGIGLVLVAGIGWIDDHRPLSPLTRLAVQAIGASLLGWGIAQDGAGLAGGTVGFVAAMVLVNVWNFMDGIDGIATTQAILVAAGYGLLSRGAPQAWLALALVAGCLGFLPFNFPRARIFLGDVGSGALGFAIAGVGTWIAARDWIRAPLLLFPLSAFVVDAGWTLVVRVARGEQWWLPHSEHAYQCWARRFRSHCAVTAAFAGWTVALCLFMFGSLNAPVTFIICGLIVAFVAGSVLWTWSRWFQRRNEAAGK